MQDGGEPRKGSKALILIEQNRRNRHAKANIVSSFDGTVQHIQPHKGKIVSPLDMVAELSAEIRCRHLLSHLTPQGSVQTGSATDVEQGFVGLRYETVD